MKKHPFGTAALVIGVLALGLAVIPGIALDQPLPSASEDAEEQPLPDPGPEGGITLKIKKFSVTFGGDRNDDGNDAAREDEPKQEIAAAAGQQRPNDRDELLRWFTVSAVSCSLIGLILGPIAWAREEQKAISGSAIGICCVALVWEYIVIGVAVGAAIAVLIIVLSHVSA